MSFGRILKYLIVGTLVGIAPLLVASAIWGWDILGVGFFGLFGGLGALGGRWRLGLLATAFLAVTGGLAVAFAWTPLLGALLLAGIGIATGLAARYHLQAIVAYRESGVYWRYTTILTPGVVMLVTQGMDQTEALTTDGARLAFTLGAIGVVVAVAAAMHTTLGIGRASPPAA